MKPFKCTSVLRRTLLSAASLALLSLSQGAAAQAKEVLIGSTLPLTGVGAFYGESARNGAALAVKHINAAGGINGTPLRVVFEDSKLEPKEAVTSLQKLIDVHKIRLVMTAGSPVVLAQTPISRERKVLLANLAATSPRLRREGEYLINTHPLADTEAEALANMVAAEHKEYAILHVESDYGLDFFDAVSKAMEKKGVKLVAREQHKVGAVDFRTNMIKLKAECAGTDQCVQRDRDRARRQSAARGRREVAGLWADLRDVAEQPEDRARGDERLEGRAGDVRSGAQRQGEGLRRGLPEGVQRARQFVRGFQLRNDPASGPGDQGSRRQPRGGAQLPAVGQEPQRCARGSRVRRGSLREVRALPLDGRRREDRRTEVTTLP